MESESVLKRYGMLCSSEMRVAKLRAVNKMSFFDWWGWTMQRAWMSLID